MKEPSERARAVGCLHRAAPAILASAAALVAVSPACSSAGSVAVAPEGGTGSDASLETGIEGGDGPVDGSLPPPVGSTFCELAGSWVRKGRSTIVVPGGPATPDLSWLTVPEGFCAHAFGNVANARQIRFAPGGEAFVASPTASTTGGGPGGQGAIVVLADDNGDGLADSPPGAFLTGLAETQGMLFTPGWFTYQDGPIIRKLAYASGQRKAAQTGAAIADITVYVSPLHWPKPLDVADDGTLYVGNGSDQGEVCRAPRPFVGGILKLDGASGGTEVAQGFRNPISLRCQRGHDHCFATEMTLDYSEANGGREKLVEVRPGDFGFPCCATTGRPYGGVAAVSDAGVSAGTPDCSNVLPELVAFHVGRSPMSLAFAPASWPSPWAGRVLVALHGEFGTWLGAEVIAIAVDPATGMPLATSEIGLDAGVRPPSELGFAAGWDDGKRDHGRPDDLDVAGDGRLFLTNDVTGQIVWFAPVGLVRPGAVGSDGGADAALDAASDASAKDAQPGPSITGAMRLFELTGSIASSSGPVPATVLDTRVAFHGALTHDFDGRSGALGCVADHFVAGSRPAPTDADAGTLRFSGFTGGALLDAGVAAQPIVGVLEASRYYATLFPSGVSGSMAAFPAGSSPLGAGPISFATAAGADFGAALADVTPLTGTLSVSEDLTTLPYAGADTTFHATCAGGCGGTRVAVRIVARSSADTSAAWPYARVGLVECDLAAATTPLVVPAAAITAMLGGDSALDTVTTSLALLAASPVVAHDAAGNVLQVDAGRGVFGVSHHP